MLGRQGRRMIYFVSRAGASGVMGHANSKADLADILVTLSQTDVSPDAHDFWHAHPRALVCESFLVVFCSSAPLAKHFGMIARRARRRVAAHTEDAPWTLSPLLYREKAKKSSAGALRVSVGAR